MLGVLGVSCSACAELENNEGDELLKGDELVEGDELIEGDELTGDELAEGEPPEGELSSSGDRASTTGLGRLELRGAELGW